MGKTKKVPITIPEGMSWPADLPLPEIEVMEATIRKTVIGEDGLSYEITETIELPVLPDENADLVIEEKTPDGNQ